MKIYSARYGAIGLFLLWTSLGVAGEVAPANGPGKGAVISRFKQVTQAGDADVGKMTPELEKQSQQIQDVIGKYKNKAEDALPELQADLDGIKTSFANAATNITDEKVKAKWAGYQDELLKAAKEGALDTMATGVVARLKLDDKQIQELQPILKAHLAKAMDIVEEGRGAGLDGVPALAEKLKGQIAENDARMKDILKPDQMDELIKARAELRDKIFGNIEDRQVAEMLATLGGASTNAAAVKALLVEDAKAKVDLAAKAADKGKDAAAQLKTGLDVVNGNTRSKLKGLVPGPDLDKLDAVKRTEDAKLLKKMVR